MRFFILLVMIILYILWTLKHIKMENQWDEMKEYVVIPSAEQKYITIALGVVSFLGICLILISSMDLNFFANWDMDIYMKAKLMNLNYLLPVFILFTGGLLRYFILSLQPVIGYPSILSIHGNHIRWSAIYRTKRINDTKIMVFYKQRPNTESSICILHTTKQKETIDAWLVTKTNL